MKLAVPLLLLAGACAAPADVAQVAEPIGCGSWGCGANSATVGDGLIFDELDSSGATANSAGLKIIGATAADGSAVSVYVKRDELRARRLDGTREYRSIDLRNLVIRLQNQKDGTIYDVLVADVHEKAIAYWEGAHEWVPFYDLMTRRDDVGQWTDLACRNEVIEPYWTGVEHAALVFQGDHYDGATKTVTETSDDDPRFNIACAATAPAKLHLMRHTRAGSYNELGAIAYNTAVKERQTMLKMLTADYCGHGYSFTHDGVPLAYNANQTWYVTQSWGTQEALWDSKGAICLDYPRLPTTSMAEIADKCGGSAPPSCPPFMEWQNYAYVMSAFPPPPPGP